MIGELLDRPWLGVVIVIIVLVIILQDDSTFAWILGDLLDHW
jgi:hypothetical protein